MMIKKIRNSRGFTLVELMIVVAIVGILAALAIYGVRKYITNAKTAEARNSLGQLSKDASAAYNREGMAAAVLTIGVSTAVVNSLCQSVATGQEVPKATSSIQGKKYQSSPIEWNTGTQLQGWQCLKFSMQDPQYFQYTYTLTGDGKTKDNTFATVAHGDLNGDGTTSTFEVDGQLQQASTGGIVPTIAPTILETSPDE